MKATLYTKDGQKININLQDEFTEMAQRKAVKKELKEHKRWFWDKYKGDFKMKVTF